MLELLRDRDAVVVGIDGSPRSADALALGELLAGLLSCERRLVPSYPGRPSWAEGARAFVTVDPGAARRAGCAVAVAPPGYARRRDPVRFVGCGFDTSPASYAAWHEALAVASAASAEVHVYAVREQHAFALTAGLDWELGEFLHGELRALVASAPPGLCVEPVLASGRAASVLRDAARTLDLLVLGAGAVADSLLREPQCPVLVVSG